MPGIACGLEGPRGNVRASADVVVRSGALCLAAALFLGSLSCATARPEQAPGWEESSRTSKPRSTVQRSRTSAGPDANAQASPSTTSDTLAAAPDAPWEEGVVSFYADSLAGNRTANGERYDPNAETCAHRRHAFGTVLEVQVKQTGRTARCRVNDRGPWVEGRVVDVSRKVARDLELLHHGVLEVRVRPAPD